MDLNEYFIIKFEKYLEIKEKLEKCFKEIKNHSKTENQENTKTENPQTENQENTKTENQENTKNENPQTENQETTKTENQETTKIENSQIQNKTHLKQNLERVKIINFIFKKLSLHTHPDKTDNNKFLELKKIKEENDFAKIYYFLLKFENQKVKNKILTDIQKKFDYLKTLVNEINIISNRINNMTSNPLWKAFYHPNELIREDLKNKILNLIK